MSTTGVQVIYEDNAFASELVGLSWPETYVDYDGITKRMPNCSMPINYGFQSNNLVIAFESGHEQRRQKGLIRRTFDIKFAAITKVQAMVIEDFYFSAKGSIKAFNWIDPATGLTHVVRFEGNTFAKEYFEHSDLGPIFRVSLKFIQVV